MFYTPKGVYIPRMGSPITIALIDDYDVVVMGVAHILEQYRDRVVIAELDTNRDLSDSVDIVLTVKRSSAAKGTTLTQRVTLPNTDNVIDEMP